MKRLALRTAACLALAVAYLPILPVETVSAEQIYVVQDGDSLVTIAYRFYGDQSKWKLLYDANSSQVAKEGNLIFAGTQLMIPGVADAAGSIYASAYGKLDEATGLMNIDIVTGPDFTPWTDDELPNGGMVTEIVERTFMSMGYKPAFEFINWPSGYRLTQKGKFAATFPYAPTEERMANFLYSDSVYDTLTMVLSKSGSEFEYNGSDDLRGKRGCRPAGYFTSFVDELVQSGDLALQQPRTLDDCFEALIEGETDLVFISELEANAKLKEMGLEGQVQASEKAINISGLHVIFPKSLAESETMLSEFNTALGKLADTGEIEEIVSRHLEAYYSSFEN